MYNRYIPQRDGTYRKDRIPDQTPPKPREEIPTEPAPKPRPPMEPTSVTGFLKSILPRDFDTGDLIIVLLLLLMAGDCNEAQNTALLTLALYVFM